MFKWSSYMLDVQINRYKILLKKTNLLLKVKSIIKLLSSIKWQCQWDQINIL